MTKKHLNVRLILISIALATLQVIILNRYSTSGQKLTDITTSVTDFEQENLKLQQSIASSSAIATIFHNANAIGLTVKPAIVSLSSPVPIALR